MRVILRNLKGEAYLWNMTRCGWSSWRVVRGNAHAFAHFGGGEDEVEVEWSIELREGARLVHEMKQGRDEVRDPQLVQVQVWVTEDCL